MLKNSFCKRHKEKPLNPNAEFSHVLPESTFSNGVGQAASASDKS
jgi:hypothetical protein